MAERNIIERSSELTPYPVATNAVVEAGNIVAVTTATGYAAEATDAAGLIIVGIADATADNTGGADGAIDVMVRSGGTYRMLAVGLGATDVGQMAYVNNSTSVENAAGAANDAMVGQIMEVFSATDCSVYIPVGGVNVPIGTVPSPISIAGDITTTAGSFFGDTLEPSGAGALNLGPAVATSVEIADTAVVTTIQGPLHVAEGILSPAGVDLDLTADPGQNLDLTLGDAAGVNLLRIYSSTPALVGSVTSRGLGTFNAGVTTGPLSQVETPQLTAPAATDLEIVAVVGQNVDLTLGDAAGANLLRIYDSAPALVASIDSNGNVLATSLDVAVAGALAIGAAAATSVAIADTLITTTVEGPLVANEGIQIVSAPGVGLDTSAAAALLLGPSTATSVTIADTLITTTVEGPLNVDEAVTCDTTLAVTGAITGPSLDTIGAAVLNIGAANATSVEIADTAVTTNIQGPLTCAEGIDITLAGALNIGAATATSIEIADTGVTTNVQGPLTCAEGCSVTTGLLQVVGTLVGDGLISGHYEANVGAPPTIAQCTTAFGAPAAGRNGFLGVIMDTGGLGYVVCIAGGAYHTVAMTLAL